MPKIKYLKGNFSGRLVTIPEKLWRKKKEFYQKQVADGNMVIVDKKLAESFDKLAKAKDKGESIIPEKVRAKADAAQKAPAPEAKKEESKADAGNKTLKEKFFGGNKDKEAEPSTALAEEAPAPEAKKE